MIAIDSILDDLPHGVIDACDFRNCSSSPATIKGRVGQVTGTLNTHSDGVRLDGNCVTFAGMPDLRPFTIVADIQGDVTPIIGWGGIIYVTAASGHNFGGGQGMTHNGGGAQFFGRDSMGATGLAGDLGAAGSALGVHALDPTPKMIGYSNDSATWPVNTCYVDGKHVASVTASAIHPDSELTQITFGAKYAAAGTFQDYHRCTLRSWAAWNRVLTPAEQMQAFNALRQLDRRPHNLLVLGDSMSAQHGSSGTSNWPWQLSRSIPFQDFRLLNHAVNGSPANNGVIHWRRRASGYTDPTTLIVYHGTAGILLGGTAVSEWDAVRYFLRKGRAEGYTVYVCTIPRGQSGGFDATKEAQRVEYNALVRNNAERESDGMIDFENVVEPLTDSAYWTDAIHLSPLGHKQEAIFLANGGL